MYRFGHRITHHYLVYAGIVLVIGLLALAVAVGSRLIFKPNTIIKQSTPVTHVVSGNDTASQHIRTDSFEFSLPSDWHAVKPPNIPYTVYSWAGSSGTNASRRLDIYIDSLPTSLAVNKLLPVRGDGAGLDVTGSVSDNCVNFTDKTPTSVQSGVAASKWGGVNFLCDMGNYERDVVATGSPEGINTVTVTGASGSHHLLLVYADNNISPDYTIFIAIIKSFSIS